MTTSVVGKIGGGFALAALATALVPRLDDDGPTPAVGILLFSAVCVAALTTGTLYLALTRDLGLPKLAALYVVAFNVLVVFVKFVLSPQALYEHSEAGTYEAFLDPSDVWGATFIAVAICVLYAIALYVIYRACRRRLESRSFSWRRALVISILVALLLLTGGWFAFAILWGGLEYVDFVFTSAVSGLVVLALLGAISLASLAFRESAIRAQAVGDAALLVSVFWVALAFLALYHVLWVVYVLVLTTIWPLRVITPK